MSHIYLNDSRLYSALCTTVLVENIADIQNLTSRYDKELQVMNGTSISIIIPYPVTSFVASKPPPQYSKTLYKPLEPDMAPPFSDSVACGNLREQGNTWTPYSNPKGSKIPYSWY